VGISAKLKFTTSPSAKAVLLFLLDLPKATTFAQFMPELYQAEACYVQSYQSITYKITIIHK